MTYSAAIANRATSRVLRNAQFRNEQAAKEWVFAQLSALLETGEEVVIDHTGDFLVIDSTTGEISDLYGTPDIYR